MSSERGRMLELWLCLNKPREGERRLLQLWLCLNKPRERERRLLQLCLCLNKPSSAGLQRRLLHFS